jgi:NADPH:quinone reductase-like Zn-dependent oxidoreductase/NADP-dependent 3-hydroxy acid dehydrogenase YdfG/acyl carrier protein
MEREIGSQCAFKIFSQLKGARNGNWTLHAQGKVAFSDMGSGTPRLVKDALDEIQGRCSTEVEIPQFYQGLKFQGLNYGPYFQGVQRLWKGQREALGEIYIPKDLPRKDQYCFHPASLDAALQVLAGVHADEAALKEKKQIYLPVEFRRVQFQSPIPEIIWSHASLSEREGSKNAFGHIRFLDGEGRLVGMIEEVVFKPLPGIQGKSQDQADLWHYRISWEEKTLTPPVVEENSAKGTWVLFDEGGELGEGLAGALGSHGGKVLRIFPGKDFSHSTENHFTLRPDFPEDFEKFLTLAFGQTAPACRGIIHLWGLREEISAKDFLKAFDQSQALTCHSVLHLVQALGKNPKLCRTQLFLLTRGGQRPEGQGGSINLQAAPLWGLGKVIALENPEMQCLRLDLSPLETPLETEDILKELLHGDGEDQVVFREGRRWVPRLMAPGPELPTQDKFEKGKSHRKLEMPAKGAYRVGIHKAGTLDSVEINPCERKIPLEDHEVELEVRAAGLNFSDVLKALGLYPGLGDGPVPLGIECSGKIARVGRGVKKYKKGDDVITVAPFCFGKYVVSLEEDLMPKPPQISFEEAATIPVAFLTAYYALIQLGRMQKGERVLIHAGAGGVGLAAIQIAQLYDCEIFATAGSPEKRKYLQDLKVHHVLDSRSLKFAEEIRRITQGHGVDLVLNSLAGDFIPASLSVLGAYGRFLEIGKIDIYTNSKIGLLPFQDNLSYFAIDLDRLFRQRPQQARTLFAELIQLFMDGKLKPLPHTDFPLSDLTQAFRYMAQRKNTGKIVVQTPIDSGVEEEALQESGILSGEKTYLVTGGLGSLGLRVSKWLVDQGARHLVLLGRRGHTPELERELKEMEKTGAKIHVLSADVSQWESLKSVFQKIQKEMPPLGGVIHAAGVLEDGILHQMDKERFRKVMAPKALGAMNLHLLTQGMPLDFFVMFSSIASVLGSPGQGNYTAANAFLDALAQYRQDMGLPALSINWGPWGEGGMAATMIESQDFAKRGLRVLSTEKGLELLGELLGSQEPQHIVVSSDWNLLGQAYPKGRIPSVLAELCQPEAKGKGGVDSIELKELMLKFKSLPQGERQKWLEQMIQGRVAQALDTDPDRVDPEKPLNTMGLDSLMALELKNEIENVLGVVIPITLLIKGPSLRELAEYVVNDLEALAS